MNGVFHHVACAVGMSEREAEGLRPVDFMALMNADLPAIQIDRKMEEVAKTIMSLRHKTDAVEGMGPSE